MCIRDRVNTNMSFANAVSNIPIVRDIAEIFTIRDYKEDNESELIDAKVPALKMCIRDRKNTPP